MFQMYVQSMHILSYVHSPWPADSEHDMYKKNTDRCWLQQAHEHLERKTRTNWKHSRL